MRPPTDGLDTTVVGLDPVLEALVVAIRRHIRNARPDAGGFPAPETASDAIEAFRRRVNHFGAAQQIQAVAEWYLGLQRLIPTDPS